jgi:PPIC-type PPIASE domain
MEGPGPLHVLPDERFIPSPKPSLRLDHTMAFRIALAPALALASFLPAVPAQQTPPGKPAPAKQEPQPQVPGKPAAAAPTPAQDPAPPKTPADKIGELQRELARLKQEIQYAREQVANSKSDLNQKLANRTLEVRAIDAGLGNVAPAFQPTPSTPQSARVMTGDESTGLPEEVMMVAEGSYVTWSEYQTLVDYLSTIPAAGDASARDQRATLELVRIHAVLGAFPESSDEAKEHIHAAQEELANGQDFHEVLNRYGTGPNMVQDGRVQITHFCPYGLFVEQAAFATEPGKISAPIQGLTGFVLLAVDKVTKGEKPDADVVDARMIVVPYNSDPTDLDKVRLRAATGQVEVKVRSDAVMDKLPPMLRPKGEVAPVKKLEAGAVAPATLDPTKGPVKEEEATPIPKKEPEKKNPDKGTGKL